MVVSESFPNINGLKYKWRALLSLFNDGGQHKKRWELIINSECWSKVPLAILFQALGFVCLKPHAEPDAQWPWLQLWMLSTFFASWTQASPIRYPTKMSTISSCSQKLQAPCPWLHKASAAGTGQEESIDLQRIKTCIQQLALD